MEKCYCLTIESTVIFNLNRVKPVENASLVNFYSSAEITGNLSIIAGNVGFVVCHFYVLLL